MNTSGTSRTSFDTMCDIIIQANDDEKLATLWEQIPEWYLALQIATDRTSPDYDITIVDCAFDDMLEIFGIDDIGFQSYDQIRQAYLESS